MEAIAKTIIADMRSEKLPHYDGYAFSRYKNTSDISWRLAMDNALGKKRAAQTLSTGEQLTLDLF